MGLWEACLCTDLILKMMLGAGYRIALRYRRGMTRGQTNHKTKKKIDCAYDELVDTDKLVPNPRNPNKHPERQLDLLAKIITYQGWRNPIVVSKRSGFIVKGHARLEAAKMLAIQQCPVDYQDYRTETDEWADMVADNRLAELAEMSMPELKDLLEELDTGALDMELTGFDSEALEELMTQFHVPEEGLTDDDEIPEKVETICKTGDLWQLGNHRLLCGDATKKEDVERLLESDKADMIFTDPPYNVNLEYNNYEDNKAKPDFINWCKDWFNLITAISSKQIIFVGNVNTQLWVTNFEPDHIAIWDKGDGGNTHGYITQYTLWEPIFFHGKFGRKRHNDMFRFVAGGEKIDHPYPKPVALLIDILQNFSGEADIIIDPFGGSGATLIACEKLGRRCFLMEIDEHYCDVIIQRWQNFTGHEAMKLWTEKNAK